ncbi:hypothetical protein yc1106_03126 [Curvularia clavata]|uniref:Uncharacterized protein n=1 Tax=Curvularia clavata TaxID=95742 RepID=A0A9Q8Z423_CURCL|nr:hypothetical protein yc1106_03126 [Curvularia clavata]
MHKPHQNQIYPLYEQEQRRKGFQNPFTTAKSTPLGSAGKRAHVQGQERLPVSDYTGESNRADEPGTGWRLLQALNELRSREKNRKMRDEGRDIRQQRKKKGKERERERWPRRRYSI